MLLIVFIFYALPTVTTRTPIGFPPRTKYKSDWTPQGRQGHGHTISFIGQVRGTAPILSTQTSAHCSHGTQALAQDGGPLTGRTCHAHATIICMVTRVYIDRSNSHNKKMTLIPVAEGDGILGAATGSLPLRNLLSNPDDLDQTTMVKHCHAATAKSTTCDGFALAHGREIMLAYSSSHIHRHVISDLAVNLPTKKQHVTTIASAWMMLTKSGPHPESGVAAAIEQLCPVTRSPTDRKYNAGTVMRRTRPPNWACHPQCALHPTHRAMKASLLTKPSPITRSTSPCGSSAPLLLPDPVYDLVSPAPSSPSSSSLPTLGVVFNC